MAGTKPGPIDLGLLSPDQSLLRLLRSAFEETALVRRVLLFTTTSELEAQIRATSINAVGIDLFSSDTKEAVDFVEDLRTNHRDIPICIIGTQKQLEEYPGVSTSWKRRFQHYYRLGHDQELSAIKDAARLVSHQLASWRTARLFWRQISEMGEGPSQTESDLRPTPDGQHVVARFQPILDDLRKELFDLRREFAALEGRMQSYRNSMIVGALLFAGWLGVTNVWQIPRTLEQSGAAKITNQLREWREEVETEIMSILRQAKLAAQRQNLKSRPVDLGTDDQDNPIQSSDTEDTSNSSD